MSDKKKKEDQEKGLPRTVGEKAKRRIKARRTRERSVWFGLGMFGMVGWTVAITTLIGVIAGLWIDRTWPGPYSWTLTMLFIGLIFGLFNAWYWVNRESRPDNDDNEK
ncbi:MAG: AtpZ/AtpI family protein [Bacillota bacterium]